MNPDAWPAEEHLIYNPGVSVQVASSNGVGVSSVDTLEGTYAHMLLGTAGVVR